MLQPERLEPGLDLGADTVVAVAYGLIVPEEVLEERRWLNVHPSLLPRWRGAAPVERALMAGDAETGVTIIELVEELDAGPIAAQQSFAIDAERRCRRRLREGGRDRGVPSRRRALAARARAAANRTANRRMRPRSRRRTGGSTSIAPRPSSSIACALSRPTSARAPSCTDAASRSGGLASATTGRSSRSRCSPTEAAA